MEHDQMNQDNIPTMPQIFLSSSANIQPVHQVFMAPDSEAQSSMLMTMNNEIKLEEPTGDKGDNSSSVCGKELLKQKLIKGEGACAQSGKSDIHQGACSSEGLGVGVGGDLSLKPSLLEEVLADKKSALMRSPEVIQFLQQQQAKLQDKNKELLDTKSEKS